MQLHNVGIQLKLINIKYS